MKIAVSKIYPKKILFAVILFSLPFSLFAEMNLNIPGIGYTDEVIALISILYYFYIRLKNRADMTDRMIFLFTTIVAIIGLLGNFTYELIDDWFPVAVDTLCLYKIFIPFIMFKDAANNDKNGAIVNYLSPISKLFLIVASVFAFLSLFIDVGMTEGGTRYGIHAYTFVFNNCGRYGYIVAGAFITILFTETDKVKIRFYEVLTLFNMFLTTKGVVYVVLGSYVILNILWRKNTKLSLQNIILLVLGGVGISTVQINSYLKDDESPRMTLIRYGNVTAKTYFPLGSGFSTYGSDMAGKNYSVLYTQYGFNNRFGLSREKGFALNDCYFGMLLGQFGYFGTVIYIAILAFIFNTIRKLNIEKHIKAMTFAMFIGVVVSAIGTAIIKSSIGVYIFSILGLVCGYSGQKTRREKWLETNQDKEKKPLIKINFRGLR